MSKVQLSTFTHRCPSCKRMIYWEKIYCILCIKAEPMRARFRISRNQRLLASKRMPYVRRTKDHLFVTTSRHTICAECGKKLNGNDLRHVCYFRSDASLRSKSRLSCSLCKQSRPKVLYPLVEQNGTIIRTKICVDCLDGSKLVVVSKRKYERKKVRNV